MIILYIVKRQNNVVHSYLFEKNFTTIIRKGVNIEPLLKSDLFCHTFDFEEWPITHTNNKSSIMPYNGSIFDIRNSYADVFRQLAEDEPYQEIAR